MLENLPDRKTTIQKYVEIPEPEYIFNTLVPVNPEQGFQIVVSVKY